jgi:hypothetical protein
MPARRAGLGHVDVGHVRQQPRARFHTLTRGAPAVAGRAHVMAPVSGIINKLLPAEE